MTNWLDPEEVKQWLALRKKIAADLERDEGFRADDYPWAMEQFVRAIAEGGESHDRACQYWNGNVSIPTCRCRVQVARLIVEALDEGT